MRRALIIIAVNMLVGATIVRAQIPNLVAAEYFFDTDPGPGNGTPITISAGTTFDISNFNMATTSLPVGWHTVCVRARNANNVWGFYECRRLYIRENVVVDPIVPPPPISAAEFFYDTDNGPGAGTPITVSAGTTIDLVNTSFANTLPTGWHSVHVRTKNQNGTWGFYESRNIFVRGAASVLPPVVSPIVELEWFVDNDPGAGLSSTKRTVSPTTLVDLVDEPLDIGVQTLGAHSIYIRAKNQAGVWSMSEAANFSVTTPCSIMTAPSASGVNRCDPGTVTLTATGAAGGETYRWYATNTSNTPLFAGNPYVTSSLSVSTTFYVSIFNVTTFCESARSPVTASIDGIARPLLNINGSLTVCEGTTQLLVAPAGFAGYTWSNGLTTQQITVATTGSYSVVVNNGVCSSPASDPFVFTVSARPSKPTITSTNGGSLCGVSNVTLSGPVGLSSYSWSTGATTQNIVVSSVGTYTLTVSNAAGCQSIAADPFPVVAGTIGKPDIAIGGNTNLCQGSTTTLTAPSGFGSYLWSSGQTSNQIVVSTAGNYSVVVGNGTCSSPPSNAVPITVLSIPAKPAIQVSGLLELCSGSFVGLTAPAGYNNYLWSNGEVSRQIIVASSGSFTVQVGQASYCMSVDSDPVVTTSTGLPCTGGPVVQPPSSPTVQNGSRCGSGEVTLTASGASTGLEYRWYDGPGSANVAGTGASFESPSISQTTDYYVSIVDPVSTLESSRVKVTATIISFSKPVLTPDSDVSICAGSTLQLTAPVAFVAYQWLKDNVILSTSAQQIAVTAAGEYSVAVGDGTCFSDPSDAITVSIDAAPTKPVISGENFICGEGTVTLTSTTGSQYLWSTNATTRSISVAGGNYTVTVFNGACSSVSDPFSVHMLSIPPKPAIVVGGKNVICPNSPVALSAPAGFANYLWSNGETNQVILVSLPGNYSVQVGESPSCLSQPSDAISIRNGTIAECGIIPSPTNEAPEIASASFGVQIQSEAVHPLLQLLSDDDDNMDPGSLSILKQPSAQGKASGGKAFLDGDNNLVLDYRGIQFAGKEYFVLQVCDTDGLCSQKELEVDVVGEVQVHNGVSPDGDGINDFMLIRFVDIIEGARENSVVILNTWGTVVFEISNYNNDDRVFAGIGNDGKELPGGTYYYKVTLTSGQTQTGYMTLKR